ncbi:MAG: hypothetical protein GWP91_01115 [Rhodobacterales bacterium]|nr:hypothetical protein [Rhodobacterales bacterium]
MRFGLAAVALMATGCTTENELRYTSSLEADTNGVALSDDGLQAHAAMSGTTCVIDTSWGCPTADEDLPTDDERVGDHYLGQTLSTTVDGVYVVRDGTWDTSSDRPMTGVRKASLTDYGQNVVREDADGCWFIRDLDVPVSAADGACSDDAQFAVNRETGTLYVASAHGLWSMGDTVSQLSKKADLLIAHDRFLDQLYVAEKGSDALQALSPLGDQKWAVTTGGPITALAARGTWGEVLVMVETLDGMGSLERRDGETGKLRGDSRVPESDGDIVVSDGGWTVGLIQPGFVHFYSFANGDQDAPVAEEAPKCIDPTSRVTRD